MHLGGGSVRQGDTMSTWGDFSTSGGIMIHVGEQVHKSLSFILKTLNSHQHTYDIPHMHHDIPLMYSWYPQCTEHTYRMIMCVCIGGGIFGNLRGRGSSPYTQAYPADVLISHSGTPLILTFEQTGCSVFNLVSQCQDVF